MSWDGAPAEPVDNVMELEPRSSAPAAAPFVRQVPKVGRNEPCPLRLGGASTSTVTAPCNKRTV